MRKLGVFVFGASLSLAFMINSHSVIAKAEVHKVYVGGMAAGFTLKTGSLQVIGTCEVLAEDGSSSPAAKAGLRAGDMIVSVEGIKIENIQQLNEIVNKSKGKGMDFEIERRGESVRCTLIPEKEKVTGKYKIGVLVRDCVSGVGTITYIDKQNNRFGALGHSVMGENKQQMQISNGMVYACSVVGVCKGVRGRAGELRGMFLSDKAIGTAEKLCDSGIYGKTVKNIDTTELPLVYATSQDVMPGNAYIYSTVSGLCPQKYEIEIVKIDKHSKDNKNYVIKVTDDKLIEETGGIVQGMSGSPIVQKGKLVGAVTHVFINDPTRGYGIDIENMLCE